ncbi:MAG: GspE/PulE family protein [Planctomycetota bacterium]|jgi:type IV pilus assembly protein PilB
MAPSRKPLGEILIEEGLATEAQIQSALNTQKQKGETLGQILVDMGVVERDDILLALGHQAGMDIVDLDNLEIEDDVIRKVSPTIADIYQIIPIGFDNGTLTIAMADPLAVNALDDLRFMLDCDVKGAVSNEKSVSAAIQRYYGSQQESIDDLVKDLEADDTFASATDDLDQSQDISEIEKIAHSAPVIKFLNLVLLTAIKDQSSDIHFEPFEDQFKIRYRIDGELLEMQPPPRHLATALISRIKVMSNLDIAERRLPQDGRIELNIRGNPIDLRVSTLPTMFGESVVMRVLDRSVISLDLEQVGLREDELEYLRDLIDRPNGIILVTGPTGCGKTTTLYSALNEANSPEVKIITTEDPVEYDLDGIVQVPIREDIGVTYAGCLRSILRQDPDKILVGEIRDLETGQIAIEASLTGHIVFSTLHTNDAPSTITSLLDMGLEPFLVAATLEAVVAQRLVRVICMKCKSPYEPAEERLMELGLLPQDVQGKTFYFGKRCDHCNRTGYRGRSAIFEIMKIDSKLRDMIIQQRSTDVVRAEAVAAGMRTLRDSGILKIFDGMSTIEEVVRETLAFE